MCEENTQIRDLVYFQQRSSNFVNWRREYGKKVFKSVRSTANNEY
jgi:hypothetical protein